MQHGQDVAPISLHPSEKTRLELSLRSLQLSSAPKNWEFRIVASYPVLPRQAANPTDSPHCRQAFFAIVIGPICEIAPLIIATSQGASNKPISLQPLPSGRPSECRPLLLSVPWCIASPRRNCLQSRMRLLSHPHPNTLAKRWANAETAFGILVAVQVAAYRTAYLTHGVPLV